jgi:peptide/nickel transport system permease protein
VVGSTVLAILRRIATSVVLLGLSSVLIFVVLRVIPGDPTITKLGGSIRDVDPQALKSIRGQLGLDHSLPVQYAKWIDGILHGNFGLSYFSQFPVTTLLRQRIGPTVQLSLTAFVLGLLFAVGAATLSAIWRNRLFDSLLSGFTAIGMATPTFVLGILLIVTFGVKLNLLPTQGYVSMENHPLESMKTVLLPAITLAIGVAAPILRILRSSLEEVGSAPFIRTAAGKGLTRREVVLGHLLPNAAIPALTLVGVILGSLIGGTVIVEYVFARPGLGTLMVDSVLKRDYQVLQALVLFAAAAFILTSALVDLLYGVVDPRLRPSNRNDA